MDTASRPFWLSKTVIGNLATTVIAIAGTMTEIIPDQYQKYLVLIVSIANIALRFASDGKITLTQK